MGDPLRYPEIHAARFLYAHKWLPPSVRDDYELCGAWVVGSQQLVQQHDLPRLAPTRAVP
eukprot:scaffold5781_cov124-Isochrysis_galbana.AAC.17